MSRDVVSVLRQLGNEWRVGVSGPTNRFSQKTISPLPWPAGLSRSPTIRLLVLDLVREVLPFLGVMRDSSRKGTLSCFHKEPCWRQRERSHRSSRPAALKPQFAGSRSTPLAQPQPPRPARTGTAGFSAQGNLLSSPSLVAGLRYSRAGPGRGLGNTVLNWSWPSSRPHPQENTPAIPGTQRSHGLS